MILCKVANLHSTMLLLYPWLRLWLHHAIRIYIPLCFYFIWVGHNNTPGHQLHLHSTMLLLYRMIGAPSARAFPIYIPLCFYFIGSNLLSLRCNIADLHSTMLLLYPASNSGHERDYEHLHSTMLLLYPYPAPSASWSSPFTFHYASTLSVSFSWWCTRTRSIYIPLCFYFIYSETSCRKCIS